MSALLLALTTIGILSVSGAALLKTSDQKKKDTRRITYELTFPTDLTPDRIVAFLTNISGSKAAKRQFKGVTTTAYELQARDGRIRAFVRLPEHLAGGIIRQLHGAIPNMVAAECQEPIDHPVTYAIEVGLSNPSRPLYIRDAADTNTAILKSIDALKPGEMATIQLVVSAVFGKVPSEGALSDVFSWTNAFTTPRNAGSDELRARRDKLTTPNFRGVLRIATHASSEGRAKIIAEDIKRVYDSTCTPHNDWRKNPRRLSALVTDIREARAPVFGANYVQFSTPEFAALVGWHIKGAPIAGLPSGQAKPLQAARSVPMKGRIFGNGTHPETSRPLAVSIEESCKHWHIVGRTGSGKTALAANLAAQHINDGLGLAVLDPKGDLANAVLDYIPRNRLDDVVVFDIGDTLRPLGLNLLDQGSPQAVASNLQAIFSHIYKDAGAVRMPEVLYHLVMILMTTTAKGGPFTFLDVLPLISGGNHNRQDTAFARAIFDGIKDPYLRDWIEDKQRMSATERGKYFQPLRSRIWQFAARPEIRHIIGQGRSSVDFTDIVKNRKIMIANFNGIPDEVMELMGSVLVKNLTDVMKLGYASEERPFALYMDEFQHFVHSATPFKDMLAEMRSKGLSMHLMHQGLDQFDGRRDLEDAVMNNAVNKVVFQRGLKDARTFSQEFGPPATDEDLKKLGKYEFMARVATEGGISPPLTGKTIAPLEPFGYGKEARRRSRATHGKSLVDVEAEMITRRQAGREPVALKDVGEEDWNDEA